MWGSLHPVTDTGTDTSDRARPPRGRRPGRDDHAGLPAQPQRAVAAAGHRAVRAARAAEADDAVKVVRDPVVGPGLLLRRRPVRGDQPGHGGGRPRRSSALQRLIVTMGKPVVVEVGGAGPRRRHRDRGRLRHRDRRRGRHVRAHRGQARAGRGDHLADRARPDEPAGRGADHAGRRGVQRDRGRGVRPGDAGPSRPTSSTTRSPRSARSLATGAAQGLRESKRILNHDLVARIDARGEEMAALSARLFASDEAKTAMTAFLSRKGELPRSNGTPCLPRVRLGGLPLRCGSHLIHTGMGRGDDSLNDEKRAGRAGDRGRAGVRRPGLPPAGGVGAQRPAAGPGGPRAAAGWATRVAWSSATRWSSRPRAGSRSSTPPTRAWSSGASTCSTERRPASRATSAGSGCATSTATRC